MAKHRTHPSDHSGAHAVGTSHHEAHAHNAYDGLTKAEGGTGGTEGEAEIHLSDHPSKLETPATSHNRGNQE